MSYQIMLKKNWYHIYELLLVQQPLAVKKYTWLRTVQKTANSSAWNHIFNFQGRGPPRKRARKLLLLSHTHESAPRNPYLPCQIMVQRKSSELEQNYGMPYMKKMSGTGGSSCGFAKSAKIYLVLFLWTKSQVRCHHGSGGINKKTVSLLRLRLNFAK